MSHGKIYRDIIETVGNTPLITGPEIWTDTGSEVALA